MGNEYRRRCHEVSNRCIVSANWHVLTLYTLNASADVPVNSYRAAPAYFSLRIFCEDYDAVVKCSPALFSMEPHDILPISIFSFSGILSYFPPHNSRGCLSSACFMLPGRAMGCFMYELA